LNRTDTRKIDSVKDELESLLKGNSRAEDFGRILRLPFQEPGKVFDEQPGFRWFLVPFWVCESLGCSWEKAVPAAAAVELMATAGDVFDDIQDKDNPSSSLASLPPAESMNVGLTLIALAFRSISCSLELGLPADKVVRLSQFLSRFVSEGCEGQFQDYRLTATPGMDEDTYFRVIDKKSGSLMKYACSIGAQVATDDPECIEQYAEFGRCLGIAFQIHNDVAFLASPQSGKSDIRERKVTLPVVYGLSCIEGDRGDFLRRVYFGKEDISEIEEREVKEILVAEGALFYANVQEKMWRLRALDHLKATPSSGVARQSLELLALPEEYSRETGSSLSDEIS